ncbi:helix-turn-helix transcriptional regulator [Novosphingobium sp. KN65.2]|uniref:helix-turn-helix transcriptional regulator n=1 Tax=Novosphingobium sp. KN65.2 TaxID=1478134 RepID=UPI0005DC76C7|nr:helix-turn-helix transcriptional regulator [Novosphingobium sp. KN65.2]CDO38106.1 putative Transcriptional regulator, XRE family [Novosphingobium sp. KN65.2]
MSHREELSRFLKSARGRLKPGDVGLPPGERRRAKGLRREEVAALAGMSVTWYTWFEQGREVQLSAPMIERLGRTLHLTDTEREYLFALAQHRPPPLVSRFDETIRPGTQHLLDHLAIPALVIVEDWTVVGWNSFVSAAFRDYSVLPRNERNLFKILMLNERYQADPDFFREMGQRLTARFKWDYSQTAQPEVFDEIIAEMAERSALFRESWERSEIRAHFEGINSSFFPEIGEIWFRHTSYAIEEASSQRLILFAPNEERDAVLLERLRKLKPELDAPAQCDR